MKAVIPVAGFGTRFLPATKAQAKEMLPVYDKPTLQYIVEEAVASGIDDILIVTGRHKKSIEDHFDKSHELEYSLQRAGKDRDLKKIRKITDLADISYVRQKNPLGLGDAVKCSQKHVDGEAFALLLGHTITKSPVPCTRQLIDAYDKCKSPIISLKRIQNKNTIGYRFIEGEEISANTYKISEIVETPKNSNLAVMGRYILTDEIFDCIDDTEIGSEGEIHLTDALSKLDSLYCVVYDGRSNFIENRLDWLKASIEFCLDDDEHREDLITYMKTYL